MENLRLYVPEHHHRNRRRLWLLVGGGAAVVLGIWALQIKLTLGRLAHDNPPVDVGAAINQAQTSLQPEAAATQATLEQFRQSLEATLIQQQAEEQAREQVGEGLKAKLEARSQTPNPETGAVAGEQTEAPTPAPEQPQPQPVQP